MQKNILETTNSSLIKIAETTEISPNLASNPTFTEESIDYAIEVDNVSKYYRLHHEGASTLQGFFVKTLRKDKANYEDFWALKDVSFKLQRGKTIGIIGQNGAGKSTLLKLVTGIIQPTTGRVKVKGRVSAMLELGTGFHPDLSARENIFLNGAIYGFSKKEMDARYDKIVDFSELGKFIDTPVKNYSSGMYMRLAFAVAITVSPDIMIIDEVLSVGDAAFGRKCQAELGKLKDQGVSMLFVSHSVGDVVNYCDEVIYLSKGRVISQGSPGQILDDYMMQTMGSSFYSPGKKKAPETEAENTENGHAPSDLFSETEDLLNTNSSKSPAYSAISLRLPSFKAPITSVGVPLAYYPLATPFRLLDTRPGERALVRHSDILNSGETINLPAHNIKFEGQTIPNNARAMVGTTQILSADADEWNYLSIYPGPADPVGSHRPASISATCPPGSMATGNFNMRLGSDGTINLYNHRTANVIVDIYGYYAAPSPTGLYYHPLNTPVRLLDTRPGQPAKVNLGTPLAENRSLNLNGNSVQHQELTIPAKAKTIVGYLSVDHPKDSFARDGWVALYPGPSDSTGKNRPLGTNILYHSDQTATTAFTLTLGKDGTFNIISTKEVNATIDIIGYYSEEAVDQNSTGLYYYNLGMPLRIFETRPGEQGLNTLNKALSEGEVQNLSGRNVTLGGITIPPTAKVLVGNSTVLHSLSQNVGAITFYPGPKEAQRPNTTNINYGNRPVNSCGFAVRLANDGTFNLHSRSAAHLVMDVTGFFAP